MSKLVARKSDGKLVDIGRPTKFTPAVCDKIVEYVSQGNYLTTACEAAGISKPTFLLWMRYGRIHDRNCGLEIEECLTEAHEEAAFRAFFLRVKRAESEAETGQVDYIAKDKSWIARMTLLERRHPDKWGKKDVSKVVHSGTVTQKVKLSVDQKLNMAEALKQQAELESKDIIETKLINGEYIPVNNDEEN